MLSRKRDDILHQIKYDNLNHQFIQNVVEVMLEVAQVAAGQNSLDLTAESGKSTFPGILSVDFAAFMPTINDIHVRFVA